MIHRPLTADWQVRQLLQRNPDSHVIATCRNPAAAAALQELQSSSGDRMTVLPLDVTDEATIEVGDGRGVYRGAWDARCSLEPTQKSSEDRLTVLSLDEASIEVGDGEACVELVRAMMACTLAWDGVHGMGWRAWGWHAWDGVHGMACMGCVFSWDGMACMGWLAWDGMHGMACMGWHAWEGMHGIACMGWHAWDGMHGMACMGWHAWDGMHGMGCMGWHAWDGMHGMACMGCAFAWDGAGASQQEAARHVSATWGHLNLLINASGLLHMPGAMRPGACGPCTLSTLPLCTRCPQSAHPLRFHVHAETSMKALTPQALLTSFQVNAMGPALVIKHPSMHIFPEPSPMATLCPHSLHCLPALLIAPDDGTAACLGA
ncbi:unnamed protein product [Closterium sp. NIES-65]|nr:unnamed protein product [Closterium sp. NIES-65]